MDWNKLKKNIGWRMRFQPPVVRLNSDGEALPWSDEDWIVMGAGDDYLDMSAASGSGYVYRLGKDQIKNFTSDPNRAAGGLNYGVLTLLVQLFTQENRMWPVPCSQPGVGVPPPPVDKASRARAHFNPEIEQLFRRQVWVLGRVMANFVMTSNDKPAIASDTWLSLRPHAPSLYPTSPELPNLSVADAQLLAEFYGSLRVVDGMLTDFITSQEPPTYNHWNVLMHEVENSIRMGQQVLQKFCPDRAFHHASPAGGTLLSVAERTLGQANQLRTAFIARKQAELAAKTPPRFTPSRRPGRR